MITSIAGAAGTFLAGLASGLWFAVSLGTYADRSSPRRSRRSRRSRRL
ncbi:hypothetical protein [Actinomadura sp. 9N407]